MSQLDCSRARKMLAEAYGCDQFELSDLEVKAARVILAYYSGHNAPDIADEVMKSDGRCPTCYQSLTARKPDYYGDPIRGFFVTASHAQLLGFDHSIYSLALYTEQPEMESTHPEIQKGNADLVTEAKCTYCMGLGFSLYSTLKPKCPRCLGTGRVGA